MKISTQKLRRIIREAIATRTMTESRGIMHIVKKHGGSKVKDSFPLKQYEFPDERTAADVVWQINDETGREAANDGNIVTVYT